VANTTVKGRHDETMKALRQALRLPTVPTPIAPLPIPPDAAQPVKPGVAPAMMKPIAPEASAGL